MSESSDAKIAAAIRDVLVSPNEADSNFEHANVVDGLFAIARALNKIAYEMELNRLDGKQEG